MENTWQKNEKYICFGIKGINFYTCCFYRENKNKLRQGQTC